MKSKKSLIDHIKSIGKKEKLTEKEFRIWFELIKKMDIIILNKDEK